MFSYDIVFLFLSPAAHSNLSINIDGVNLNFIDVDGLLHDLLDLLDYGHFFFHNLGDDLFLQILLHFVDNVFLDTLGRSLDNLFNDLLDSVRSFNVDNFFNRNFDNLFYNLFDVFGDILNAFGDDFFDDFDGNFDFGVDGHFFNRNLDCDSLGVRVLLGSEITLGSSKFSTSVGTSLTEIVFLLTNLTLTDDFLTELSLFGYVVGRVVGKLGNFVEVPFSIFVGVVLVQQSLELIDLIETFQVHLVAPGTVALGFEFVEFRLVDNTVVVQVVFFDEIDQSLLVEILHGCLVWHF